MIPLGGKIREPVGKIVSPFEDLLMVQYHCGAMSATSVGDLLSPSCSYHVGVTNTWGELSMCDTPPHINILQVDLVHHFINATIITTDKLSLH
jgi:hypothetical protein